MASKCAVVFFDEIDALGQSRGAPGVATNSSDYGGDRDGCSRRVLAELLIQLNRVNSKNHVENEESNETGMQKSVEDSARKPDDEARPSFIEESSIATESHPPVRVIVVAATNRPEDCDPALVRRFSTRVMVALPSQKDRKKILKRYMTEIDHSITNEQFNDLALMTDGWSGSDLESLSREAAMAPVRECIRSAALLKKRIPQWEQKGGDSSSQGSKQNAIQSQEEAKKKLLEQFRNLRQVSFRDFEEAIAFWSGNHYGSDSSTQPGGQHSFSKRLIHYDSSSDEEE